MGKWYGSVGYVTSTEIPAGSGVWREVVTEHNYYGDFYKNTRRLQNSDSQNDNITVSNQISIVTDPYAHENIFAIRYATYLGQKWKVDTVDVQYPRLILTLGGLYNEH